MENGILTRYLNSLNGNSPNEKAIAFYAALDSVATVSPLVSKTIINELKDQRGNLKLIASENYSSLATQLAMGNWLTDKYAEGYAGHRFYAGCDNVDILEEEACKLACELFGAEHAYVQPHSGADANLVAFTAVLSARVHKPLIDEKGLKDIRELTEEDWLKLREKTNNQKLMAMDIGAGGHLTHGYRLNISSLLFESHNYGVDRETGLVDLDALRKQAHEVKPLILLAGFSAYPRKLNFAKIKEIADEVGAVFMVDMAHFAGLVAGGVFTDEYNPIKYADIVTSTTHKTLRGPRGGIVLCKKEFAEYVDKGCPFILGGPLPHVIAAKVIAFKEALHPEFKTYSHKIVENSQALAEACKNEGMILSRDGTDNHLLLLDVFQSFKLTGRQAESALRECGLTMNRNALPYDVNGVWYASGLRLGTPAVTTLGMGIPEMKEIASIIKLILGSTQPETVKSGPMAGQISQAKYILAESAKTEALNRVKALLAKFVLYPELDLELMEG